MTVAELIERLARIPDQSMIVTIAIEDDDGTVGLCADDPLDDPDGAYLDFDYAVPTCEELQATLDASRGDA